MEISKGDKIILKKPNGRTFIEITRHEDPIMDNILVVSTLGGKKQKDSLIIEKDLETWISYLGSEGYTEIKKIKDVGSSKKNNKKKN